MISFCRGEGNLRGLRAVINRDIGLATFANAINELLELQLISLRESFGEAADAFLNRAVSVVNYAQIFFGNGADPQSSFRADNFRFDVVAVRSRAPDVGANLIAP